MPVWAHHELAAEFDDQRPVTLKGTVTKFEWNNPHVYFFVDVQDARGGIANWALELASPSELKNSGWNRESLQVGDPVTVEGNLARDGTK